MKQLKYCLLNLLVFCGYMGAFDGKKLDAEKINTKSLAIKQMIRRHTHAANAFKVVGALQAISILTPMVKGVVNSFVGNSHTCDNSCIAVDKPERVAFFTALREATSDVFFTANGWKTWILPLVGQGVVGFILHKVDSEFFHPDTLRWYISAKVPYKHTVAIIKDLIKRQSNGMDDNAVRYNHESLLSACYQLVGYGEDMCAYMVYKSGELDSYEKESAERTVRYFFNFYNDILSYMFAELDASEPRYLEVNKLLVKYENELSFQLKHFASIEREIKKQLEG